MLNKLTLTKLLSTIAIITIAFLLLFCKENYSEDIIEIEHTAILSNSKTGTRANNTFKALPHLHQLIIQGDEKETKRLLKLGYDTESKDEQGKTPFHYALLKNDTKMIKILLEYGADFNYTEKEYNYKTPLEYAQNKGYKQAVKLIQERQNLIREIVYAVKNIKYLKKLELFLELGVSPNSKNLFGEPLLMIAAQKGNIPAMRLLIGYGANVNAKSRWEEIPLHFAHNSEVVSLLIENGADIENGGTYGNTILHNATLSGKKDIVRLLIERGVNLNLTNDRGNTPLHQATKVNDFEIARMLVEAGAKINVLNQEKLTPLHYAVLANHTGIVDYFIKNGADINKYGTELLVKAKKLETNKMVNLLKQAMSNE